MEVSNCWKKVEFPKKSQLKSKIVNILQDPNSKPPQWNYLPLWNKTFLKELYRNIQTFAFKVLRECSFWASRNAAVQMFFLTPNRKMFARKFIKSERLLAVLREQIIFNVKWVEVPKISEVVWAKLYCKMSDLLS